MFGLLLQSNRSLPGVLPCAQSDTQVDLRLLLGTSPEFAARTVDSSGDALRYASADTDERGEPQLRVWKLPNGHSRIEYSDGTTFWIDEKLSTIWGSWPAALSLENAASYLFGPILGILLRFRGQVCLHASAVVLGDECLVLSGPAGAGKSTTAAAFARAGYPIISDDIAALIDRSGTFYVTSAYPYLCLWPESVEMLYGSPDALPKIAAEWDKRQLPLGTHGTQFSSKRSQTRSNLLPRRPGCGRLRDDRQIDIAGSYGFAAFEHLRLARFKRRNASRGVRRSGKVGAQCTDANRARES